VPPPYSLFSAALTHASPHVNLLRESIDMKVRTELRPGSEPEMLGPAAGGFVWELVRRPDLELAPKRKPNMTDIGGGH
jgi:hypothetical protein